MLQYYATILHASRLGWAMSGGVPWLWPVSEVIHLFGMTLLLGTIGVIDLRVLGVARSVPLSALRPLRLVSALGFVLTLATGIGFFAGDPTQYLNNLSTFGTKLLLISLAGVNGAISSITGLSRRAHETPANEQAPLGARLIAGTSLLLWVAVMYLGRMLSLGGGTY
jgi:hypothetical protein